MAFPAYIPTRTVTIGSATGLESSESLRVRVEIRASRSLIWDATGERFETTGNVVLSDFGTAASITLPRTDVAGWRDAATGALIDVSAPDSHTHTYYAYVTFMDGLGVVRGGPATFGPFTVPNGTGAIDLDLSATVPSVNGVLVGVNAPIDSPTFTGDPKAPTPATTDNDTSIATTAFVQSAAVIRAGSDLGSVHLDTVTTPGIYHQVNTATLANGYPIADRGTLEVIPIGSGVGMFVTQRYTVSDGAQRQRVVAMRRGQNTTGTTWVWEPWRSIPTQRVDTTAGRVVYTWDDVNAREQIIYGDTGMRDVSSLLTNGWSTSSGVVYLRRVGWTVLLAIANLSSAGNPTADVVIPAISGFNGSMGWVKFASAIRVGQLFTHKPSIGLIVASTLSGWADTGGVRDQFTWHTNDAWPTTLPGTAVGTIPNV